MRPFLGSVVLAAALTLPASAGAAVRYDFAGTFTTSDIASSFAVEGGFTSGTGSYSGFVEFDAADPGPNTFIATDAFLSIGSYTFGFADPAFSSVSADVTPPDFTLLLLSLEDFSAVNLFDFLVFSIHFSNATTGIGQNLDPALGSVNINLAGDSDALNGTGIVTSFDLTDAPPAVPEPGAWLMMIVGFGLLGAALRFRGHRISQVA